MGKKGKKNKFVPATNFFQKKADELQNQEVSTPKKSKCKGKDGNNLDTEAHQENVVQVEVEEEIGFVSAEDDEAVIDIGEPSGISLESKQPENDTQWNPSVPQGHDFNRNALSFVSKSEHGLSDRYNQNAEIQNEEVSKEHSKYYESSGLENKEIVPGRRNNEKRSSYHHSSSDNRSRPDKYNTRNYYNHGGDNSYQKSNRPGNHGEDSYRGGRGRADNRWDSKKTENREKKYFDNTGYKGRERTQESSYYQARDDSRGPPADKPHITDQIDDCEDWDNVDQNIPDEAERQALKEEMNEISNLQKLDLYGRNTWRDEGFSKVKKKKDPRMERERLNKSDTTDEKPESSSNWRRSEGGASWNQRRFVNNYLDTSVGSETRDEEFSKWEKTWLKIKDFKVVKEIVGDLFDQPRDVSLAHCVAEDLRMGSGIAVDFKREFKNLPDLLDQRVKQGGLATLHDDQNKRFVYYLVTKRESTGKPTYLTVFRSLWKMREHIKAHQVRKLAIPRLGCGLDRLEWDRVKSMIEYIFNQTDVEITVCNFQQNYGQTKKKHQTKAADSKKTTKTKKRSKK